MENLLYDRFSKIPKRTKGMIGSVLQDDLNLKSLMKSELTLSDKDKIIKAFCNELEAVLKQDDVIKIVNEIFNIEHRMQNILNMVYEESSVSETEELPDFNEFYKSLSPILLRAIVENSDRLNNSKELLDSWREAIRVVVEQELYYWKNKTN